MADAEAPCIVRRVIVRGAERTRDSVVTSELRGLSRCKTLGAIGEECLGAVGHLHALDIFESADVLCDRAPGAGPNGELLADVVVTVKEKKRLASASTGVHTTGGEGSMDAAMRLRNALGLGERLELNMEMGQHKSNGFRLSAARPRWLGTDTLLSAELSKSMSSHLKHSSYMHKLRSAAVSCRHGSPEAPAGCHELTAELSLREVCKLPLRTASWSVLEQRGLSFKAPTPARPPAPNPSHAHTAESPPALAALHRARCATSTQSRPSTRPPSQRAAPPSA